MLDRIRCPADLRQLDADDLDVLAAEIRERIVATVAATGGHLGSNLGIVELTLALHRSFESPRDLLLFDTGHQTYPHKLVTGRAEQFATLRQPGGLSGYPSQDESEHDWIENSHASTVLSYADGLAAARAATGTDGHVVAVIGDGALTGGMAYEALNNLGHYSRDVIVVLNDNGRSYAPTVSRLTRELIHLRATPGYVHARDTAEAALAHVPVIGDRLDRLWHKVMAAGRAALDPPAFFEQLGVRHIGPVDGHDIDAVETALQAAKASGGPVVVHVLTTKGRGYGPAEADDVKRWHDTGRFDPTVGPSHRPFDPASDPATFADALSRELLTLADERPDLTAITAAMPGSTGLRPLAQRHPGRVVDVGIAEQHATTAAAGMAMGGLRPVVAVYATFLSRAFDQVVYDVALHRLPVVFCLDRAGITGTDGPSHHGVYDLALFSTVPGMAVFAPANIDELAVMLRTALDRDDGPSLLRWPKGPAGPSHDGNVGAGMAARKLRTGRHACVLALGSRVTPALQAADQLAAEGVDVSVWDMRLAAPLDPAMIADAAGHDLVVTVEDGIVQGGVGQQAAAAIAETAGRDAPHVCCLGVPTRFIDHGKVDAIHRALGLDADGIAAAVTGRLDLPA